MPLFVLVVLLVWLFASGGEPVTKLVQSIRNGARVGPATSVNADGIVPVPPVELARAAGLALDVYSLARMVSSEHGTQADAYCVAVAWAIRNRAERGKKTVTALLTARGSSKLSGFYGRQDTSPIAVAATRADPYERHARIAAEVMAAPAWADPTGGATDFYSPRAQRALNKRDPQRFKPAEEVDRKWQAGGLRPVAVAGVDSDHLTLYRKVA